MNRCLFCGNTSLCLTDEHIIPDSLLFKASEDIVLKDCLCQDCNSRRFGSGIDLEFLDNVLVKLLRIIHKDFVKNDKVPAICFQEFKTITLEQYDISLDLILDSSFNEVGALIKPTRAPISNKQNSRGLMFLRDKDELSKLNANLEKKQTYIVSNRGAKYVRFMPISHREFFETMNDWLVNEMVFTRFIAKMGLEYLAKSYGPGFIFRSEFTNLRQFIMRETDNCNITYRLTLQPPSLWADYISNLRTMEYVSHTIGIRFDEKISKWYFLFNMFNVASFCFVLPESYEYTESHIEVRSLRNSLNG